MSHEDLFAFPTPASEYGVHGTAFGMTLRDYFAAKALQGTMSSPQIKGNSDLDSWRPEDFADFAYRIVDAMLAARTA